MFSVKIKSIGEILNVFSVQRDTNGFTQFLIYRNNKWQWVPSEAFEPVFIDFDAFVKSKIDLLAEMNKEVNKIMLNEEGEDNA